MKRMRLIVVAAFAPALHAADVHVGHTGTWNDPGRSGEGFTLEFIDPEHAVLAWYTFDEQGDPRWLYAVGDVANDAEGERLVFNDLYESKGGAFTSPTAQAVSERVGTASIRFSDCNQGTFSFDAYGQSLTFPVQRLIRVMSANCEQPHGAPMDSSYAHAGQSGTWFDPLRLGQGLQLQWLSDGAALLGWYTFDEDGNQYWLTGLGQSVGEPNADGHSEIRFETVYSVRGARFGAAFDPNDVAVSTWGTLTLRLGCDAGTVEYASVDAGFGSGQRDIQILTRAIPGGCPWARPKLSDLYDIEYAELPAAPSINAFSSAVHAMSLANDGTVVAIRLHSNSTGAQVLRLRPGAAAWDVLAEGGHGHELFITPDASRIISRELTGVLSPAPITVWTEQAGWVRLGSNLGYKEEVPYGLSQDGQRLVGTGFRPDQPGSHPWHWNSTDGQKEIIQDPALPVVPLAISNDGSTVIGIGTRFIDNFPVNFGRRWRNDGEGQDLLHGGVPLGTAFACDAQCDLIYGSGWAQLSADDPRSVQAWIWRESGETKYLGALDDEVPMSGYGVTDVSADGSIVVGVYLAALGSNAVSDEGWLWSEQTGILSLRSILQGTAGEEPWTERRLVSASSDGKTLLISGWHTVPPQLPVYRAAILRLVDKTATPVAAN